MLTNAAEIIRYTSAGWTTAGIQNFENMLTNVFYRCLNGESAQRTRLVQRHPIHSLRSDHTGVQYQANVGTGNTKAMMAFGVFTSNITMQIHPFVNGLLSDLHVL